MIFLINEDLKNFMIYIFYILLVPSEYIVNSKNYNFLNNILLKI